MDDHPRSEHYVTIPYFLYEAMARSYYYQPQNADLPVEDPPSNLENLNLKGLYFNPIDIPSNWKPGGVAKSESLNGPDVPIAEETG